MHIYLLTVRYMISYTSIHDSLWPKQRGDLFGKYHCSHMLKQGAIQPLGDAILHWWVSGCEFHDNTLPSTEGLEGHVHIFTATIASEPFKVVPGLGFNQCSIVLKVVYDTVLCVTKVNGWVAAFCISEWIEIALSCWSYCIGRPPNVRDSKITH